MHRLIKLIQRGKETGLVDGIKTFIMLILLYLYLMFADLSTAPEFIYNQF